MEDASVEHARRTGDDFGLCRRSWRNRHTSRLVADRTEFIQRRRTDEQNVLAGRKIVIFLAAARISLPRITAIPIHQIVLGFRLCVSLGVHASDENLWQRLSG